MVSGDEQADGADGTDKVDAAAKLMESAGAAAAEGEVCERAMCCHSPLAVSLGTV